MIMSKYRFLITSLALMVATVAFSQSSKPILKSTTKIVLYIAKEGRASTRFDIYPDSIACKRGNKQYYGLYPKKEFKSLIKELSDVEFSARQSDIDLEGDDKFSYLFVNDDDGYLQFSDTSIYTGSFKLVFKLIDDFIDNVHFIPQP